MFNDKILNVRSSSLTLGDDSNSSSSSNKSPQHSQYCDACGQKKIIYSKQISGFVCANCGYNTGRKLSTSEAEGLQRLGGPPVFDSSRHEIAAEEAFTMPIMGRRLDELALGYRRREFRSQFENIGRNTAHPELDMLKLESKGITIQRESEIIPSDNKSLISTAEYNRTRSTNQHFIG